MSKSKDFDRPRYDRRSHAYSPDRQRHKSPNTHDMPPPWRNKKDRDTKSHRGSDERRTDDRDRGRRRDDDHDSNRGDYSKDRERRGEKYDVRVSDRRDEEKRKKESRKNRSSSSSSSSDGETNRKIKSQTAEKELSKKQKALMKATETPEDKRLRRMQKKDAKERIRREKMGWDREYLGYTNDDNPFGDHQLSEAFVWKKKLDSEGKGHLTYDEVQQLQRRKMETTKEELESVRRRRMEREKEREDRDLDIEMTQREKELEYFRVWEHQEDKFHLDQAKLRSRIRIADGRAKPIDLLSKYISDQDEEVGEQGAAAVVEMHEPAQFLVGLTSNDLEDLLEDIKVVYMELEQGKNAEYWRDITTVVEDELKKLHELDAEVEQEPGASLQRYRGTNISEPVLQDIANILKGKTYSQLSMLDQQVDKKLQGGEGIDVAYWETLLQRVRAQMARTRLRERHQETLRRKLEQLKQEQGILSEPLFPISALPQSFSSEPSTSGTVPITELPGDASTDNPIVSKDEEKIVSEEEEASEGEEAEEGPVELGADDRELYDSGRYSPVLLRIQDLELEAVVYEAAEEKQKLAFQREQVLRTGQIRADAEDELMRRARDGMTDDEAQFSVQVPLEDQSFLWSDKYRPRKPRFFNRVHTGFEWNKYNQTHYDMDNPPPKIVQGYKFNIFYPDLIDKSATPTYTLTAVDGEREFMLLRFRAGPPYEDIAFKIVNREWEYSYKHGFRCQFQNNIFQLWFHFKRFRYRR